MAYTLEQAEADVYLLVTLVKRLERLHQLDAEFLAHFGYRSQMFANCIRATRLEYIDALRVTETR